MLRDSHSTRDPKPQATIQERPKLHKACGLQKPNLITPIRVEGLGVSGFGGLGFRVEGCRGWGSRI